jgi:hypothetical protein
MDDNAWDFLLWLHAELAWKFETHRHESQALFNWMGTYTGPAEMPYDYDI